MDLCKTCGAKGGLIHLADGTTMCVRRTWVAWGATRSMTPAMTDKAEGCKLYVAEGEDPLAMPGSLREPVESSEVGE